MTTGYKYADIGYVHIADCDLSADCRQCGEHIEWKYPKEPLSVWNPKLRIFIREHRACQAVMVKAGAK